MLLGGISSSFLPGISVMGSSTMGPLVLPFISIVIGVFIFPVAGALWARKGAGESKAKLGVSTLLVHTLFAYGLLVSITLEVPEGYQTDIGPPIQTEISAPEKQTLAAPTIEGLNYYEQGLKLLEDRNYPLAIENLTGFININPKHLEAYMARGHAYASLEQYDKALVDYEMANQLDKSYVWPYHYLALTLRDLGRYQESINNSETYVELRLMESDVWSETEQGLGAYFHMGEVYFQIGQYKKSIEYFDKVLEIDEDHAVALQKKLEAAGLIE